MMWQHLESLGEAISEVFMLGTSKSSKISWRRQPIKDKHSSNGHIPSLGVMYGQSSMQGWRERMEDAYVTVQLNSSLSRGLDIKNGIMNLKQEWDCLGLFGVFDGHGGAHVANFCARHLPREMEAAGWRGRSVAEALHESFHSLDNSLQDSAFSEELMSCGASSSDQPAHSCGCTAAACCVMRTGEVIVANAGDCRVVLSRQGVAQDLSQDHKPNLPKEHARIRNAGGQLTEKATGKRRKTIRINGGLNVSRTIGDHKYKQNESLPPNSQMVSCTPDMMTFRRSPQDEFMVIACDGVWDVLSSQQVVDAVRRHLPALHDGRRDPSDVAEEVLDMCLSPNLSWTDGIGGDNMTLMIIVFTDQRSHAPVNWATRTDLGWRSSL
jgi:protein phosphatase 2C family protein 2/3